MHGLGSTYNNPVREGLRIRGRAWDLHVLQGQRGRKDAWKRSHLIWQALNYFIGVDAVDQIANYENKTLKTRGHQTSGLAGLLLVWLEDERAGRALQPEVLREPKVTTLISPDWLRDLRHGVGLLQYVLSFRLHLGHHIEVPWWGPSLQTPAQNISSSRRVLQWP